MREITPDYAIFGCLDLRRDRSTADISAQRTNVQLIPPRFQIRWVFKEQAAEVDRFEQSVWEPAAKDCNSLAALQEVVEGLAVDDEVKKMLRPGRSERVSKLRPPPKFKARHSRRLQPHEVV